MKKVDKIKILMFGWEFPPYNSGGLGVACEGLARNIAQQGVKITFVLPKKINCESSCYKLVFSDSIPGSIDHQIEKNIKAIAVNSLIKPYVTSKSYSDLYSKHLFKATKTINGSTIYSDDLMGEVLRYGQNARKLARTEQFDVIHVHDWLSFPAGIEAKEVSGKPLITHIHSTEFDRTGGNNINQGIYDIEREGLSKADLVITVSNFTKDKVVQHYGISPDKIRVVHNAVEFSTDCKLKNNLLGLKLKGKKIVLFVGRITLQKGPDYFLKAAKRALEINPNIVFIIAGAGDMERQILNQAAHMGIADKILFPGFLRGEELVSVYKMADLYVLPSVSEPFGISVLESLKSGTPVLISRQSGVSEVISHCLKVDFWDTNQMAEKMVAVLTYPELYSCLKENGTQEVEKFNWKNSAEKCIEVYKEILNFK